MERATQIYNYYYSLAIREFDAPIAHMLAKIPADYVYNSLQNNMECYIDNGCCLEYCNEMLDSEFDRLDPEYKRRIYEKSFNVRTGNVSDSEINLKLKAKRRAFKKLYYNAVQDQKENSKLDQITRSMKNVSLKRNLQDYLSSLNIS